MEREHITLIHNSILSYHVPSGLFYNNEYCVGYHCHTTSIDLEEIETSFDSNFDGNTVSFRQNYILQKIHDISVSTSADLLAEMQINNDRRSVPDERIREGSSYKNLFPDREVLMSLDDLKDRISLERFNKLAEKWRCLYIFPDGRDALRYFEYHHNCHMIIPPNWLSAKSICSSPHLFDELHSKLQLSSHSEGGSGDARDASGGTGVEGGSDDAGDEDGSGDAGDTGSCPAPVRRRKYEEIKRNNPCVDEQVKAMLDYLENGDESTNGNSVMKMLRGEIPGITEDDSGDYVYVNTNFFRAIHSQMTKHDREYCYRTNTRTDHGRYMCCVAVALDYLQKTQCVPMGGVYNTRGHQHLMRVNIAVPMFKNHIIEYGSCDHPISNMVCMVTMNNYCRTAIEVHQFEKFM